MCVLGWFGFPLQIVDYSQAFLGDLSHDQVIDTSLADFWAATLDQLYNDTRMFRYGGDWPAPLLVSDLRG